MIIKPRKIDGTLYKILNSHNIKCYRADLDDDITYVLDLEVLGHRLGHKWTSQTDIGVYKGYWFKRLKEVV